MNRRMAADAPVGLRIAATTTSVSRTSLTSETISYHIRYHGEATRSGQAGRPVLHRMRYKLPADRIYTESPASANDAYTGSPNELVARTSKSGPAFTTYVSPSLLVIISLPSTATGAPVNWPGCGKRLPSYFTSPVTASKQVNSPAPV